MQTARLEIYDCGWLELNIKVVGFDVEAQSVGVKPHCLQSVTAQTLGMSTLLTDILCYKLAASVALAPTSLYVILSLLL